MQLSTDSLSTCVDISNSFSRYSRLTQPMRMYRRISYVSGPSLR